MIVRNWMQADPLTVSSDTLVSKAKRLLVENNLRALPVVDDGHLRGMITRVSCLRAAEQVTRTEDPHEFNYFANRLRVKDLMVRSPITVEAGDTMEHCLRLGQERRASQFPVLEDGRVVGLISAAEVFYFAAQVLGVWQNWSGITLAPMVVGPGTLGAIADVVEGAGAAIQSLMSVGDHGVDERRIVIRFTASDTDGVAEALMSAGYKILEVCADGRVCRDMRNEARASA